MNEFIELSVIGRGSFGIVSICRSVKNGAIAIMKKIHLDEMMTGSDYKAAQSEVEILTMLRYPHIIEYYTSFMENDTLTLVMEYAMYGTLYTFLLKQNGILLPQDEILFLIAQLLLAVRYIHDKNILHRDIKPQNILLTGYNGKLVKLGDFGVSKILESSWHKASSVVGTLCYMSPELCRGEPYGIKCDIWSLGCVFYNIFTLRVAFDAPTLAGVLNKIMHGNVSLPINTDQYDANLADVVNKMLNKKASLRPSAPALISHPLIVVPVCKIVIDFGFIFNESFKNGK